MTQVLKVLERENQKEEIGPETAAGTRLHFGLIFFFVAVEAEMTTMRMTMMVVQVSARNSYHVDFLLLLSLFSSLLFRGERKRP